MEVGPQQSDEGSLFYEKPGRPGIWRFRGDEDVEEQIVDGLDAGDWGIWRVSSGKLVYLKRGRPTVIMRHELQTGGEDTLFVPPKRVPGGDPAIDISADGSYLLFGQVDRSESDLMIVEGFGSR